MDPAREYYAVRYTILNVNTVSGSACGGCEEPACLVLNSVKLVQSNATSVKSSPAPRRATSRRGRAGCRATARSCPCATARGADSSRSITDGQTGASARPVTSRNEREGSRRSRRDGRAPSSRDEACRRSSLRTRRPAAADERGGDTRSRWISTANTEARGRCFTARSTGSRCAGCSSRSARAPMRAAAKLSPARFDASRGRERSQRAGTPAASSDTPSAVRATASASKCTSSQGAVQARSRPPRRPCARAARYRSASQSEARGRSCRSRDRAFEFRPRRPPCRLARAARSRAGR